MAEAQAVPTSHRWSASRLPAAQPAASTAARTTAAVPRHSSA
jgi:hypothetical protein